MIKIHELEGDKGRTQSKKRIGRGEGSGQGKTAGKGHKGQQARAGTGRKAGFEGGQMPLIRRIPKFGFTNHSFAKNKAEITLGQLNNKFENGATVDFEALNKAGLVAKTTEYYKVIATGELSKKLTVKAHGFSASAREAIEKAGGSCENI